MAKTPVAKGSIRGPQGIQGVQGPQGPAGRTFDPEGSVPTKAALVAMNVTTKGKAYVVSFGRDLRQADGPVVTITRSL